MSEDFGPWDICFSPDTLKPIVNAFDGSQNSSAGLVKLALEQYLEILQKGKLPNQVVYVVQTENASGDHWVSGAYATEAEAKAESATYETLPQGGPCWSEIWEFEL